MSQILIYVQVPPYLKEWLIYHFGDPVVFPKGSPENAVIRTFISKRPDHIPVERPTDRDVSICIPENAYKRPQIYNYMGPRCRKALLQCIRDIFKTQMWSDLNFDFNTSGAVDTYISAWMERNGIGLDSFDTIKKMFYTIRRYHLRCDINLMKKTRNYRDKK